MSNWGRNLKNLMDGRYGTDNLSTFLMGASVVFFILAFLSRNHNATITFLVIMGIMVIFSTFRMFSRNHMKRKRENFFYLKFRNGFRNRFRAFRDRMAVWKRGLRQGKAREKNHRRREKEFKDSYSGKAAADSKETVFNESLYEAEAEDATEGVKYCLFPCPGCGVEVRVPGNKGRIVISCPKCGTEFERVS